MSDIPRPPADAHPTPPPPPSPLIGLGSAGAAVCVDGVCTVPGADADPGTAPADPLPPPGSPTA